MTRAEVVRIARSWLGTPYRHQHSLKGTGADCLGLLRGVFKELYGYDPEPSQSYSPSWDEVQKNETMLAGAHRHLVVEGGSPRPGDVLVFRMFPNATAKHCGIVATDKTMVHAHQRLQVVEVHLVPYWRRRIVGVFSFPGVTD